MTGDYTVKILEKMSNEKLEEVMDSKFLSFESLSREEMITQILEKQQDQLIHWHVMKSLIEKTLDEKY